MSIFILHSADYQKRHGAEYEAMVAVLGKERMSSHIYKIPAHSVVVPRFRAIPFGKELEDEIAHRGARLINTYAEHRNIANIFVWAKELSDASLTPAVYGIHELEKLPEGEYFVKGETNSLKFQWHSAAYAPTRSALFDVISAVSNDSTVGGQALAIRPFVHFRKLGEGIVGQPIFHERRAFVYGRTVLGVAPYWSSYPEFRADAIDESKFSTCLYKLVNATEKHAPFRVIDMAELPTGEWQLIELNDGSMSGLSDNDAKAIWKNLSEVVR